MSHLSRPSVGLVLSFAKTSSHSVQDGPPNPLTSDLNAT